MYVESETNTDNNVINTSNDFQIRNVSHDS